MANITDETANSVFYKTRIAASRNNEQLSSREGAADILSIDRGRLYRIEKGVADPYPEGRKNDTPGRRWCGHHTAA